MILRNIVIVLMAIIATEQLQLLPFGPEHGDRFNIKQDDGCSQAQTLARPFSYMSTTYNSLYVCNNGIISFGIPVRPFVTMEFPITGFPPAIMPLWADTDVRDPLVDFGDESDYGNRVRDFEANYILEDEVYNVYLTDEARDAIAEFGDQGYECSNGFLILHSWVCDGSNDCPDGADESDCLGNFVCNDGTTIHFRLVCDGFNDCDDGVAGASEDEQDCSGRNEERLYSDDALASILFTQRGNLANLEVNLANNIFRREITESDSSTLGFLTSILREKREGSSLTNVVWAYVVTWYHVGGYRGRLDAFNTFQCVLMTTSDASTFVVFNYKNIQWTRTENMEDYHAQAGFNYGNGGYYMLPFSKGYHVRRLAQRSNVNDPGLWIFNLHPEEGARCEKDQINSISPDLAHAYGGQSFRLTGFCNILESDDLKIHFKSSSREKTVNASLTDDDQIVGIYPYWGVRDSVVVRLLVNGALLEPELHANYHTDCGSRYDCWELEMEAPRSNKIRTVKAQEILHVVFGENDMDNITLITPQSLQLSASEVQLRAMEVIRNRSPTSRITPLLREIWQSVVQIDSQRAIKVPRDALRAAENTGNLVHFVVSDPCQPNCQNLEYGLFLGTGSSMAIRNRRSVGNEIQDDQQNSASGSSWLTDGDKNNDFEQKCRNWLEKEEEQGDEWHEDVAQRMGCPRKGENEDFESDLSAAKSEVDLGTNWKDDNDTSCDFCDNSDLIEYCISSESTWRNSLGEQFEISNRCCYNTDQELIRNITDGAGRSSLAPLENTNATVGSLDNEKAFDYCCPGEPRDPSSDLCQQYLDYRPVQIGSFWTEPPEIPTTPEPNIQYVYVHGEQEREQDIVKDIVAVIVVVVVNSILSFFGLKPHYLTMDGLQYSFNGLGVFTLTATHSRDFSVQIATRQYVNGAVISAMAIQDGDEHTCIYLPRESELELSINFRSVKLGIIKEYSVGNTSVTEHSNGDFSMVFPSGWGIKIMPRIGFLNFYLNTPVEYAGFLEGLMGNFNGKKSDDLETSSGEVLSIDLLNDGEGLLTVHEQFGESWRVHEADWLFPPTVAQRIRSELQNSSLTANYNVNFQSEELQMQAEQVCSQTHYVHGCLLDVFLTGDIRLAELQVSFRENLRVIEKKSELWRDVVASNGVLDDNAVTRDSENITVTASEANGEVEGSTTPESIAATGTFDRATSTGVTNGDEIGSAASGATIGGRNTAVTSSDESTTDVPVAGGKTSILGDDEGSSLVLIIGLVSIGVVLAASVSAILIILFRTITARK